MRAALLLSLLLLSTAVLASQNRAVVFVNSAITTQRMLVDEINQALFYSPTLRSRISIEIVDLNVHGSGFSGAIKYRRDVDGRIVAAYRPTALPYVICLVGEKTAYRGHFDHKEQLCICTNHC